MNLRSCEFGILALSCALPLFAQTTATSSTSLQLSSSDLRSSVIPANSNSTVLSFNVESDTTGENTFDVSTSDPGVVVSLILPSGTAVTSLNAASLGFTFSVIADGELSGLDIPSTFSLPGTHTMIQIPAGQPSGAHQIAADARSVSTDSAVVAVYDASSTVQAAATTDKPNYSVGGTVILSALIFDNGMPIAGASVTGVAVPSIPVNAQATVATYQLISQQTIDATHNSYEYSVTLANNGLALHQVEATLSNLPAQVTMLDSLLVFGDVAANASTQALNTVTIQEDNSQTFDPGTLQWNVTQQGSPVSITLSDSGAFDAAPGDGIYTGTFTPVSAGTYSAILSITGSSLAGVHFSRAAVTHFEVTDQPLASFASFSDAAQSGGVAVTSTVNVQTAGLYQFTVELQAGNGNIVREAGSANLASGSQQIGVQFSETDIAGLGVDGPYERSNALLVFKGNTGDLLADSNADAGPTAAYTLSSFAPPGNALSFTGQNTATGISTSGGTTFDLLRVQAGVSGPGGVCSWSAMLTDCAGHDIDSVNGVSVVQQGAATLQFDFNGPKIARTAVPGSLFVQSASVHCGGASTEAATLMKIDGFVANQFTNTAADFSLQLTPGSFSLTATQTANAQVTVAATGGFAGVVNLSLSGLPAGTVTKFVFPSIVDQGATALTITLPANAAPGTYPVTLQGTSSSVAHSISFNIIVSAVSVSIVPPGISGHAGQGLGIGGSSSLDTDVLYWLLGPPVGHVTGDYGGYRAPSVVDHRRSIVMQATSKADPTKSAFGIITLIPDSDADMNPAAISLTAGQSRRFNPLFPAGWFPLPFVFSISPQSGTIDDSGLYTAPNPITQDETVVVTATNPYTGQALTGTVYLSSAPNEAPSRASTSVGVAPDTGAGATGTFQFIASEPYGGTAITSVDALFNGTQSEGAGCSVHYDAAAGTIALKDDSGSAWTGPAVPIGQPATLSNSQCSLDAGSSSANAFAEYLVLSLRMTFKPAFSGRQEIFMRTRNSAGFSSDWCAAPGSWTVPPAPEALPPGWSITSVGALGDGSSVTYAGGLFAVSSDDGSWSPDAFEFVSTPVIGDLTLVAHLQAVDKSGSGSSYGIMLRSSAAPDASYAFMGGGNSLMFQWGTGSYYPQNAQVGPGDVPYWFKLARQGDTVSAFSSVDGTRWSPAGSVPLPGDLLAGIVVASPRSGQIATATFGDVSLDLPASTNTTASNVTVTASASDQTVRLTAAVSSGGAAPGVGTVTFTVLQGSTVIGLPVSTAVSGGNATASYTIPGGTASGIYTIQAVYSGGTGFASSTDNGHLLTIVSAPPTTVSVTPGSGAGASQTFAMVYADANGAADLSKVYVLFNAAVLGANGCYVYYDTTTGLMYLYNDAGSATTSLTPGSGTINNSQCTLSGAGLSVTRFGSNLTMTVALTFSGTFTGAKNIYMYAAGSAGNSGWVQKGTWTAGSAAPTVVSVSPSSGAGISQPFSMVYSDPNGATDLSRVYVLFNTSVSAGSGCYVYYDSTTGMLNLYNNAGSATTSLTPGSGSISNSQCTLAGAGSSVALSGNNLTMTLALTFSGTFTGSKNIYMYAATPGGLNSGWATKGTWTAGSANPTIVSLSPSSGSGISATFTMVYADPNGAADLSKSYVLFNGVISAANGCYVYYDSGTGMLNLYNNAGSATTSLTPGSGSVSNSQCTLTGAGSSVTRSGNNLTMTLVLTFSGTFTGTKNVYLYATGSAGSSGWVQKGTWTP